MLENAPSKPGEIEQIAVGRRDRVAARAAGSRCRRRLGDGDRAGEPAQRARRRCNRARRQMLENPPSVCAVRRRQRGQPLLRLVVEDLEKLAA